jgi:hypothetical protein
MTDKMEPVAPIKTLVTEAPTGPKDGDTIKTPAGQADIQVVTMTWYGQVGIRVVRTYLQSLLGFVVAMSSGAGNAVGMNLPATDFGTLMMQSASLALAPAVISLIQNAVEILAKMDTRAPQLRA